MRNKILAILFLLLAIYPVPTNSYAQKKQHHQQKPAGQVTEEIFQLVNKHRTGMGLKPLKQNDIIAKAAIGHSRNMANKTVPFGHDGFDDRMAGLEKQIKDTRGSAENVAYSSGDAKAVVDMWLHSPGHRKNIEGNYTLSGIGMAKGTDGTCYYTQIFIKN